MTIHSLFFCLRPDPATALRLSDWSMDTFQQLGLRPRPARTERLHVTLQHLGWFDDESPEGRGERADVCEAAMQAAAAVRAAPVRVDFDELLSFTRKPHNRPLVLSGRAVLDDVRKLREALGEQLRSRGLAVERAFTPHLTLTYDDAAVPSQPVAVPGWLATDLHLIDSLQGQSRHVPVASWVLAG